MKQISRIKYWNNIQYKNKKSDKKGNKNSIDYSLSSLLEKFINYLEYTKNSSPKTIENHSILQLSFINNL